jgi:hypothetical protein
VSSLVSNAKTKLKWEKREISQFTKENFSTPSFFFVNFSQKYSVFRFWSRNRRTFHFLLSLSPKVIHNQNRYTPVIAFFYNLHKTSNKVFFLKLLVWFLNKLKNFCFFLNFSYFLNNEFCWKFCFFRVKNNFQTQSWLKKNFPNFQRYLR